MRISFVVNTVGLTGGIKVIFEYAKRLSKKGHQIFIIHPCNLEKGFFWSLLKWLKYKFLAILGKTGAEWFNLPREVKILHPFSLHSSSIPDADIIVATANETAEEVFKLPKRKGEKFYFIQDYEIWTREKEKVEATYKLPLKKIVIASWLKKLIKERFNQRVYGVLTNGVNFDQFYPVNKKINPNKRILMVYHLLKKKGIDDGIKAYKIVKKIHPEVQLVMISAYPKGDNVPSGTEFYFQPPQEKLKEIYSSCDIFLSPSWQEGCQLPPMEAMACQTAVVATNVGGIPDYTIPGETALVVPPKRPDLLAEKILELLEDKNKLKKVALSGYKYIKQFTWEKAVEKLERIFQNEVS